MTAANCVVCIVTHCAPQEETVMQIGFNVPTRIVRDDVLPRLA